MPEERFGNLVDAYQSRIIYETGRLSDFKTAPVFLVRGGLAMNKQRYKLRLIGLQENEGQIKATSLRHVIDALLKTAERATRLLATGEGSGRGPRPKWLDAAVDFTVTGLMTGSTVLDIEAPSLRETAPDQFAQQDFWREQPKLDDTALDIAARAIEEAKSDDPAGDRFDSSVLEAVIKFNKAAGNSETHYELIPENSNHSGFKLDREICVRVQNQLKSIPSPKAFIVSGMLDEIRHGGGRFRLLLGRNSQLLGRLHNDFPDIEALRPLWGKLTTVEGIVHFKANGQPRLIEARRMRSSVEGDRIFEELPMNIEGGTEKILERFRSTDVSKLEGSWPGDESIEELMSLLD